MSSLPPLTLADLDRMPGMHHVQPKGIEADKQARKRERAIEKKAQVLVEKKLKRRRKLISKAGKTHSFGLSTCKICKSKGKTFAEQRVKASSQKIFHRDPNICSKCRSAQKKFVSE